MPDAWEILVSHSGIPSGDAWEHINAIIAGQAECGVVADIADNVMESDITLTMSANVVNEILTAEIEEVYTSEVGDNTLEAEV